MKFSLATILATVAAVSAAPSQIESRDARTLKFYFHAAATGYELSFPADGQFHDTSRLDLNVNLVETPAADGIKQCEFKTEGQMAPALVYEPASGKSMVAIGPPQPIVAVKCWGECATVDQGCSGAGQANCCSGYCGTDNKCHAYVLTGYA
ncbi:hypothetical protein BROUX41_002974 [Berkeleyomyces rouxiae]|uniref:uncharacterized protein n=1 Tax=Berkeleyomyces rouxiae TaxID=2035830 RepID=UPI003B762472